MRVSLTELIAPSFYELHHDVRNGHHKEYWLKGGRGSTKSTFVTVEILLGMISDPDANAVIFRKQDNQLRESVYGQFEWTANKMGIAHLFKFQVSPMQIVSLSTGQKIVFKGADKPENIKSVNLGRGYIKYAWFEEVDQFNGMAEIRNILQSLFRGENRHRISFYSFNPPKSARSWVNQEVKIAKPGRRVHHSTYLEVPKEWLGDIFITEAEHLKKTNPTAYDHEYLGKEVGTGLEVFTNVVLREIKDSEIAVFDRFEQGLDFGYAVDPLAFERVHFQPQKRRLYFVDEISGINMFNREFFEKVQAKNYQYDLTTADSAEPKSIDELSDLGMKIVGAKKGPGSVEHGIKFLQDLDQIIIDPARCPLAAKEFVNYALERNRQGEVISKFPDADNHTIDATRYALESHHNKSTVKLFKGGL